jgi:hypothetical protein
MIMKTETRDYEIILLSAGVFTIGHSTSKQFVDSAKFGVNVAVGDHILQFAPHFQHLVMTK